MGLTIGKANLCLGVFVWLFSVSGFASTLNFYTFNIRWYGSNVEAVVRPQDRDAHLKTFIATEFADADVIAFEEIVDLERFYAKVLPDNFNCKSYIHPDHNHQHVVLCYKKTYKLLVPDGDDNYIEEDVSLGRLRPAVYGILADAKGRKISYIVGLHLKAETDHMDMRLEQIGILDKRIKELKNDIPVVILGDLNTNKDDQDLIGQKLQASRIKFQHVHNPFDYTFRTLNLSSTLDHFFVSPGVEVVEEAKVLGPCNIDITTEAGNKEIVYYNRYISDHCPVRVRLGL